MRLRDLVAAAAILVAPCAALAASQDFTVVNRTGYPIQSIYVGEAGSRQWGNDVMGRDTLYPGERVDISFERETATCRWDLMVRYRDDTRVTWDGLNLCETVRIGLFWDKLNRTTVARVE